MTDTVSFNDSWSLTGSGPRSWLVRAMQSARPLEPPIIVELPGSGSVRLGRGDPSVRHQQDGASTVVHVQTDDARMSSDHARLIQRAGNWVLVDDGSKNGSYVNGARITTRVLEDADRLEIGGTVFVFRRATGAAADADVDTSLASELPALRTAMPELASQLAVVRRVAASAIRVLIQGETGTGKELVAQALHTLSGRQGEFVAVNCGALPTTLIESQLFGFKKGAFSGAESDSLGLVRAADGGTLFLDEIAELSPSSQVALLRVLQEGDVLPIGATSPVKVDVRVIAATHRDLPTHISEGAFREDLFARVAGAVIELPPVRSRKEDIGLLVSELLRQLGGDRCASLRFSRKTMRALFQYDWPRNIRELRGALELALTNSESNVVELDHLPAAVYGAAEPDGPTTNKPRPAEPTRDVVCEALRVENGNVSAAARRMGYSRAHMNRLIARFGVDPGEFRT